MQLGGGRTYNSHRENAETSDGRRRRGRYVYQLKGPTTALAKIAEIELYGYATAVSD